MSAQTWLFSLDFRPSGPGAGRRLLATDLLELSDRLHCLGATARAHAGAAAEAEAPVGAAPQQESDGGQPGTDVWDDLDSLGLGGLGDLDGLGGAR